MSDSQPGSVTQRIDLAARGDPEAKAWLWQRFLKLLYAMAHDHGDDEHRSGAADTSDVVADVGVRFADDDLFAGVHDREHFKNRLRLVVSGKAIDQIRREAVRATAPLGDDSQGAPAVQDEQLAVMNDLLDQLPLSLHGVALAMLEGETECEAAERLGLTRHNLRVRLAQIRELWSKHLSE